MAVEYVHLMLVKSQSERCGDAFRSSDERGLTPPRMTLREKNYVNSARQARSQKGASS